MPRKPPAKPPARPRKPSQAKAEASLAKRRRAAGMRRIGLWLDADVVKLLDDWSSFRKSLGSEREIINDSVRYYLGSEGPI